MQHVVWLVDGCLEFKTIVVGVDMRCVLWSVSLFMYVSTSPYLAWGSSVVPRGSRCSLLRSLKRSMLAVRPTEVVGLGASGREAPAIHEWQLVGQWDLADPPIPFSATNGSFLKYWRENRQPHTPLPLLINRRTINCHYYMNTMVSTVVNKW